jgi:nickel-dependent lactate racemase
MPTIRLPQLCWHGACALDLPLPEGWQVEMCRMAGHDRPELAGEQIREALRHPASGLPISEGARGKKNVCIIFDDMSRPTRVAAIVPHVLEELRAAGIADHQIRFVCALGAHGALTRPDFVKKLGEEVVSSFPVFNHNLIGNHTLVGRTSTGVELRINAEVAGCDYKITIGCVVPHAFAGFGGGAKMILPGVAAFETIRAMHRMKRESPEDTTVDFGGMGCVEGNRIRETIDEAAGLVGLDFMVGALVNEWGETVSVHAGRPRRAFARAVEEGRAHYLTPQPQDCDVVITNTFAKANEGEGGSITGFPSLRAGGGDLVLVSNAPEGHVSHYLLGAWGTISPGEFRLVVNLPLHVERLILFNEYPDLTATAFFSPRHKVLALSNWEEVLSSLRQRHGPEAKVAVYTSAEIQYCGV